MTTQWSSRETSTVENARSTSNSVSEPDSEYPPRRLEDSVAVANSGGGKSAKDVVLPPWMSEALSGEPKKHLPVPFDLGITDIWIQGARLVVDIMPASQGEEVGGWQGGVLAVGGPMILVWSLILDSLLLTGLIAVAIVVVGLVYWHIRSIPVSERLSLSPVGLVLTGRTSATLAVGDIQKYYMGGATLMSSQPAIVFVDKKGKKYRFGETLGRRRTSANKVVPTTEELEWVLERVDEHMEGLRGRERRSRARENAEAQRRRGGAEEGRGDAGRLPVDW